MIKVYTNAIEAFDPNMIVLNRLRSFLSVFGLIVVAVIMNGLGSD